jgi:hypothetical protein
VTSSILLGGSLILLVLVIAGVYASVFALARDVERRRVTGYQAYCSARGYTYLHVRPGGEAEYVGVVEMFRHGASHIWRHEITGPDFVAFEYLYTVGFDDRSGADREAMIKWEDGNTHRPRFAAGPKALPDRIAPLVGAPDIDFPEGSGLLEAVRGARRRPGPGTAAVSTRGSSTARGEPRAAVRGGRPNPLLVAVRRLAAARVARRIPGGGCAGQAAFHESGWRLNRLLQCS